MSRKGNCDNSVMEDFFGRLKTEIYYGIEVEYSSFKVLSQQLKSTSIITISKGFRQNKMDVSCKVQGNIHVFWSVNNMCLGK